MFNNIIFDTVNIYNYNSGFLNTYNDTIVHLLHWQYWWWFWFTFLLSLYYIIFIRFFYFRSLKFHPKITTSFRSHGKWGDLIICVLPISWCLNILSNSTTLLKLLEWQSESNFFVFRVRGKQWYWIYKFDSSSLENLLNNNTLNRHFGTNNILIPKLARNKLNLKLILETQNLTKIRQNTAIKILEFENVVDSTNLNIITKKTNFLKLTSKPLSFFEHTSLNKFNLCSVPKNCFFNYSVITLKLLKTNSNFQLNDVSYNRYFRDVFFNETNVSLLKTKEFNFFSPIKEYPLDYCFNSRKYRNDRLARIRRVINRSFSVATERRFKRAFKTASNRVYVSKWTFFVTTANIWRQNALFLKNNSNLKNSVFVSKNYFKDLNFYKNSSILSNIRRVDYIWKIVYGYSTRFNKQQNRILNAILDIVYKTQEFSDRVTVFTPIKTIVDDLNNKSTPVNKISIPLSSNPLKFRFRIAFAIGIYVKITPPLEKFHFWKSNIIQISKFRIQTDSNIFKINKIFQNIVILIQTTNKLPKPANFSSLNYFFIKTIQQNYINYLARLVIKTSFGSKTNYLNSIKIFNKWPNFVNLKLQKVELPVALLHKFWNPNVGLNHTRLPKSLEILLIEKLFNKKIPLHLNQNYKLVVFNIIEFKKRRLVPNYNLISTVQNYTHKKLIKNLILNKYQSKILMQPLNFLMKNKNIVSNTQFTIKKFFIFSVNLSKLIKIDLSVRYNFLKFNVLTIRDIMYQVIDGADFKPNHKQCLGFCLLHEGRLRRYRSLFRSLTKFAYWKKFFLKNKTFKFNLVTHKHLSKTNKCIHWGKIIFKNYPTGNILFSMQFNDLHTRSNTNNLYLVLKQKPISDWSKQTPLDCFQDKQLYSSFFSDTYTMGESRKILYINNMRLLKLNKILFLPSNLQLTAITNSFDVIHSWFLPGLGLKMDCVPGRSTHHSLFIDVPGIYYGQCAEICGRFHHHMPIRVCALSNEHFLLWLNHNLIINITNNDTDDFSSNNLAKLN